MKRLNHSRMGIAILVLLLVMTGTFSLAQKRPPRDPAERIQKDLEQIYANVDSLTDIQKMQIESYTKQFVTSLQQEREQATSREAIRPIMRKLNKDREEAIKKVLTPSQLMQYEALRKKQREERGQQRNQKNKDNG